MAIINFSVPQDLKDEFEKIFSGRNRSALIVDFMREAVAEERRHGAHEEAIDEALIIDASPPFIAEENRSSLLPRGRR